MPTVGSIAPEFVLPNQDGNYTRLNRLLDGRNGLVVFFFRQAGSPGCTRQATGLRDIHAQLEAKGIGVVGICPDPVSALAEFAKSASLPFDLLSDADGHNVSTEWGVWLGDGVARQTFIVDSRGVVEHAFTRVNVNNHADEILAHFGGAAPLPAAAPTAAAAPATASAAPAAPLSADQGELLACAARCTLRLLLAHLDGGGALPPDLAELAAQVAARKA